MGGREKDDLNCGETALLDHGRSLLSSSRVVRAVEIVCRGW
jgi:hypothetical protein